MDHDLVLAAGQEHQTLTRLLGVPPWQISQRIMSKLLSQLWQPLHSAGKAKPHVSQLLVLFWIAPTASPKPCPWSHIFMEFLTIL
ncbi:hypothetical protein PM04_16950 [Thalassobacter sp. 16PALIMAR09]|nr:hypothetical protein PM04_16950 [Thalassobacter sp. 16PALIMAR09]